MTKFFSIVFILSFLIAGNLNAQKSPQILFDEANILLEEGEYPEALQKYRQIEQLGSVSGPLFLNMGVAATQIDSMGLAKFYFLKASGFELTEVAALDALEYVNAQFSRQSATLPKLPWDKAVDWLRMGPGASGVFLIGFIFIVISFVLILLHWFKIYTPKSYTGITLSLIITSIVVVGLSFYVDYVDQRYSEGVVIDREIQVRQRPDTSADLVSLAYEGYPITIDKRISGQNENWIYIRLGNGQFGWIPDQGVKTY